LYKNAFCDVKPTDGIDDVMSKDVQVFVRAKTVLALSTLQSTREWLKDLESVCVKSLVVKLCQQEMLETAHPHLKQMKGAP
jgi:hypothetical protein